MSMSTAETERMMIVESPLSPRLWTSNHSSCPRHQSLDLAMRSDKSSASTTPLRLALAAQRTRCPLRSSSRAACGRSRSIGRCESIQSHPDERMSGVEGGRSMSMLSGHRNGAGRGDGNNTVDDVVDVDVVGQGDHVDDHVDVDRDGHDNVDDDALFAHDDDDEVIVNDVVGRDRSVDVDLDVDIDVRSLTRSYLTSRRSSTLSKPNFATQHLGPDTHPANPPGQSGGAGDVDNHSSPRSPTMPAVTGAVAAAAAALAVTGVAPTPAELISRLHVLLDEVVVVLQSSYTATLHPSARRVQSLHTFYDQIYDLLHPPSPDLFAMSASDQSLQSSSPATGPMRGQGGSGSGLTASHVERLEREWWESEVVAAWYGPRPAALAQRPPLQHSQQPLSPAHTGPAGDVTRPGMTDGVVGVGVGVGVSEYCVNANQRDREAALKRDASYVGLYDE